MYTWSGWILIDSNSGYTVFEMYYLVLDINRCQELCDTEDRSTDFFFFNFTLAYTLIKLKTGSWKILEITVSEIS
jgi:hypothetical protein